MGSGFIKNIIYSLAIAIGLLVFVNVIGELMVRPRIEQTPAKPVDVAQPKAEKAVAVAPAPVSVAAPASASMASLLAAYDPQAGKKAFRKCMACHTSNKAGKNRVGPNLWDVVGRKKGSMEGFRYSEAMRLKGGSWTYDELSAFLTNPRTFVKGTRMAIKGYKDPAQRATLIGYLRALSDNPKALPD